MKHRSPPRTRPVEEAAEPQPMGGALLQRALLQSGVVSVDTPQPQPIPTTEPPRTTEARQDWREKLGALVESGALTTAQEADCFRLFEAQEAEVREAMPRLLAELKPHFDTDGEMDAKQRFTEALQEMKHRQHEEFSRLLASFGMDSAGPPAA